MKKILLASTILVGSAGVAAADISFSGSAYMGIGTINNGALWVPMATASMDISMSGETDGGLMFGADFTLTAGTNSKFTSTSSTASTWPGPVGTAYYTSTFGNTGGVGYATVWISGDFGKVSLAAKRSGGSDYSVLGYSGTFGSFGVDLNYTTSIAGGPKNGDWDAKFSYDFGDYDVYYKHSWDAISGVVPGFLAANEIGGSGTFGDFTVSASYSVDSITRTGWDLGVDWASGAISVGGGIGLNRATQLGTAKLTAGYDLGGGASIDFAYNDLDTATAGLGTEKIMLGVSMDF